MAEAAPTEKSGKIVITHIGLLLSGGGLALKAVLERLSGA